MIYRSLESAYAAWLATRTAGTALADIPVRHGIPTTELAFPCVLVAAQSSELVDGGVRRLSRVSIDFSVITAASATAGWQAAHKERVSALSAILDDRNTSTALVAINSAQSSFTLWGWFLSDFSSDASPNHQTDTIRLVASAGDRVAGASTPGPTASPQDFSVRHEIEELLAAHLAAELPSSVTDDYEVQPFYAEATAKPYRIVAACASGTKPFAQLDRWQAASSVHVLTPATYDNRHADTVALVEVALRTLVTQDFTSSDLTVAGLLESDHRVDRDQNRISDVLGLNLYVQIN
jgi:hypothetical protein